jgi:membrane fusion protein, multidrug efflux system
MHARVTLKDRLKAQFGSSLKPMLIMLACVGVVFGGLFGYVGFRSAMMKKYFASAGMPPQTVSVATANTQEWRPKLSAVGAFRAVNGADLALEAPGLVEKIHFQSGDEVAAGQMLLELRKDTDNARLLALKATAELSAINLRRDQAQLKVNGASQAAVDTDLANLKNANAEVAQQAAVIEQKTLRAPFAGRLGIRQVDFGQYLGAGTTIVTIQALDPIYLDFSLPQQALNGLATEMTIAATVDAFPKDVFTGKIVAISPKVDAGSRNVAVRASIANPERRLRPGMFAAVDISVGAAQRQVTLPQTAIVYAPYGNSVFLAQKADGAGAGLVARRVFVRLGATRGDEVAVLEGVSEGASVVTAGQIKLRNGVPLIISASAPPPVAADPKPVDQ